MKVRFSIDDYKTKFSDGIRQYLFFAMFQFPSPSMKPTNTNKMTIPESILSPLGYNSKSNIYPYLVKSTSIPDSLFNEEVISFPGLQFKMAGERIFGDWLVSFNIDENGEILDAFNDWHNIIYNVNEYKPSNSNQYMMTQHLYLIDGTGTAIKDITLHNAWPKSIGQVSLDYASSEIATVDVSFSFQHYTITKMQQDGPGNTLIRSLMNRVTGTSPSNLIHGALGM